MSEQPDSTQAEELNKPAPEVTETPTPATDTTLGEIQNEETKLPTVGLDKFMSEKTARREAEERADALAQEIEELRSQTNNSFAQANAATEALAEEYDIDPVFLSKLKNLSKAELRAEIEAELMPTIQEFKQDKFRETTDKKFSALYTKVLDENPEYSGIVNQDVIKTLALDPKNAKKTLPQIIEEAYGNAIPGKKTLERGGSGKEPAMPNLLNPTPDELEVINASPTLKKQHSDLMQEELKKHL